MMDNIQRAIEHGANPSLIGVAQSAVNDRALSLRELAIVAAISKHLEMSGRKEIPTRTDKRNPLIADYVHDGHRYDIVHLGYGDGRTWQWSIFGVYGGGGRVVEFSAGRGTFPSIPPAETLIELAKEAVAAALAKVDESR